MRGAGAKCKLLARLQAARATAAAPGGDLDAGAGAVPAEQAGDSDAGAVPGDGSDGGAATPASSATPSQLPQPQPQPQPQQQPQQPRAQPVPLCRGVFISHAGKDERGTNLASGTFAAAILKPALEAAGAAVFMDFSSLQPGCAWLPQLVDAAAHSAAVVVVLSASYVQRFWCMLELDVALHGAPGAQPGSRVRRAQPPLIIPVYFDDPAAVAAAIPAAGGQDWQAQLQRLPPDLQWLISEPACWAANVATLHKRFQSLRLRTTGEPKDEQLQLARSVVAAAVAAVAPQAAVDAVGFDQQAAQLTAELVVPDDARLGLWLHGPGGLGKSTMARLLFNTLVSVPRFACSAFLELDAEEGTSTAQQRLSQLLKQLGAANINEARAASQLMTQLRELLRDKAVLLVLDNIWTTEQLDALLPLPLGRGSCLLVTSRFEQLPVSRAWPSIRAGLHRRRLATLDADPATLLFRTHSGLDSPPQQLASLETAIVAACDGLPLALIVIGALLADQTDARVWQGVLDGLRSGEQFSSEGRLKGVLSLSFRGLTPAAQSMFLDSVSVLRGQHSEAALAVWEAWWGVAAARLAWAELQRRSLVSTDRDGRLAVHDVLSALGQAMLRDPQGGFYGSRVWVGPNGRLVELSEATRQELVAVSLRGLDEQQPAVDWTLFQSLKQLRLFFSRALDPRWLRQLLAARQLLWLEFRDSRQLTQLPESFGQLAALQRLDLSGCWQLTQLRESFGQLAALQRLDLSGCSLSQLPESFGQLAALQRLDLSGCPGLSQLPESFGQLAALQQLDLSGCSLSELPESFVQLAALQQLDLSGCWRLRQLPESLRQLAALQRLWLPHNYLLGPGFGAGRGLGEPYPRDWDTTLMPGLVWAAAQPGDWVAEWRITAGPHGVTSIQGVTQRGRELPALAATDNQPDTVISIRRPANCFTKLQGRAGAWLDAFMGVGTTERGSEWTFSCKPGRVITGYAGVAGACVGTVHFVQREEPAALAGLAP